MAPTRRAGKGAGAANGKGTPEKVQADDDKNKLLVEQTGSSKWKNMAVRAGLSFAMTGALGVLVALGPLYLSILVIILVMICYQEIISIGFKQSADDRMAWYRSLNWYFVLTANYFLYGESLLRNFAAQLTDSKRTSELFRWLISHHRFVSMCLYMAGFVWFVASLEKWSLKKQFQQFAWTHLFVLLICVQATFVVYNIFAGLFWFITPAFLVICNDVTAYFCGFFFGRTQLWKLSPKKTVEGFVGAFFLTLIFSVMLSTFLGQYEFFTCPEKELSLEPFVMRDYGCNPPEQFHWQEYHIPEDLQVVAGGMKTVTLMPAQIHAFIFALFASIIAPFGGFFASGFKRAFQVKDFGTLIPGHGGVTDRFDCQFLMATFVYVYFSTFIESHDVRKLKNIIAQLSPEARRELGDYIYGLG
eukprot:Clim_evm21s23 gene=Clim_evmTU21s23